MIEIIPNWHPIWVHFAVALLFTSAALFLIFGWGLAQTNARSNALIVARWTLRLGVFAAIGALLSGYFASGSVTHDDVSHANMMVHRNWAFATTFIFVIAAVIDYLKRTETRVSAFSILFLLLAGSVTLAVTGLEGAENVYQYGLGVQNLPDVSMHEHSASANTSEQEHASDDHGHGQSRHADATAIKGIENNDHPASSVATQLADAIAMGDIDSLRAVVAPNVIIFESGGVESSLKEYEGHHMPADMAFMKAMRREELSRQVIDSGDSVTVVTRSRIHGKFKDREIDQNNTETLVMKKVKNQWKVVHIHWSSS